MNETRKYAACCGCGRRIHENETAIRKRGYLGFWCSPLCLIRDLGIGEMIRVTEEAVAADAEEDARFGWEENES